MRQSDTVNRIDRLAARERHPELPQGGFGLIFVDVHGSGLSGAIAGLALSAGAAPGPISFWPSSIVVEAKML